MSRKKGQKPQPWTKDDLAFLKATYLLFSDAELGKILNRDLKTIHTVRVQNGLYKRGKTDLKRRRELSKIPVVFVLPKEYQSKREHLLHYLEDL